MTNDAGWAESARQFQQMLGESWGNMLQALQPGELGKAMTMQPSSPVTFTADKIAALQQQYMKEVQALWGQGIQPQMPSTADRRFAGDNWANAAR